MTPPTTPWRGEPTAEDGTPARSGVAGRPHSRAAGVRALVRRADGAYELEVRRPGGPSRARHHTLVAALNAEKELRQLWRPASSPDAARLDLGPDVLFVVPDGEA